MNIIDKFKNQRLSAQIINFNQNPQNHKEMFPRVHHCCRTFQNLSSMVDLWKKPGSEYAFSTGLQTCGSPWVCPVCGTKISEYRKNELSQLIELALKAGKHIYMLTTTLPHYAHENCQIVLDKFTESTRKMKYQKPLKTSPSFMPWGSLIKEYQLQGYVITKEVLFGKNGWHIHSHGLFIFDEKINNQLEARERFFEVWLKACDLTFQIADYPDHVFRAFIKRSIRLDYLTGDAKKIISEYMTKSGIVKKEKELEDWKMEHEMTKGHLKKSESDSLTPFGMLDKIRSIENSHDPESIFLKKKYYEYTEAFKGTSFVRWSPGLRDKYGIKNITDEEIVKDENEIMKDWYGFFDNPEWKTIVKKHLRGFMMQNTNLEWNDLAKLMNDKLKSIHCQKISNKQLS